MQDVKKIAKVSKPSLYNVYPRKRLFKFLDYERRNPVVWVHAPPGSGKTTLVSSYLDESSIPHIWYQMDAGDKDVASFFNYMKLAAQDFSGEVCTEIPNISADELASFEGFARHYFRVLFSIFKQPSVVVIDDFHEASQQQDLDVVMRTAVQEIPSHVQVIFISREPPPKIFAKLRINGSLSIVDWRELQLTHDECKGIGKLFNGNKAFSKELVDRLYSHTEGWVAGLVLLLQSTESELPSSIFADADKDVIFDYFATEILEREASAVQEFLLETSVLGQFTLKMAQRFIDAEHVRDTIKAICTRNYFINKKGSGENQTFSYHPLFKEFLENKLEKNLTKENVIQVKRRAANVLLEAGDLQAALTQLTNISDWRSFKTVVLENIEKYLDQGQYLTVKRWLTLIPDALVEEDPWLRYWMAVSRHPFYPQESPDEFDKCFNAFMSIQCYEGAYYAWAKAVESIIFRWTDMSPIDRWIEKLNGLMGAAPDIEDNELEARVTVCIFSASIWRKFDEEEYVSHWASRAEALLGTDIKMNYRMSLATALVAYYGRWKGDLATCVLLAQRMSLNSNQTEIAPVTRTMWYVVTSMCYWMTGQAQKASELVDSGIKELQKEGVKIINPMLAMQAVYACLANGDLVNAYQYIVDIANHKDSWASKHMSHYHFLMACVALEDEQAELAKEHAEKAMEYVDMYDTPLSLGFINLVRSQCFFESREVEKAYEYLKITESWSKKVGNKHIDFQCRMTRAQWLIDQGSSDGESVLADALAFGVENDFVTHPWWGWRRESVIRIYDVALKKHIEREYVKRLISVNNIIPKKPELVSEHWPWVLKIHTLGNFSISINGKLNGEECKLQGKSLELLTCIVVYGGSNVSVELLIDSIWPDAEGDAGHHALETTLYRLRKTLGDGQILVMQSGRLSLNPAYVWVDIFALDLVLKNMEKTIQAKGGCQEIQLISKDVFGLYAGEFMENFDRSSEILNLREKTLQNVSQVMIKAGMYLESLEEWGASMDIYQNCTLLFPTVEKCYARLMYCQYNMGHTSDLVATYKRCEKNLYNSLGAKPSLETETLHNKVING